MVRMMVLVAGVLLAVSSVCTSAPWGLGALFGVALIVIGLLGLGGGPRRPARPFDIEHEG